MNLYYFRRVGGTFPGPPPEVEDLYQTEAPPAERVGSGGPPEGGDYFGKAPLGLFIHHVQNQIQSASYLYDFDHECTYG